MRDEHIHIGKFKESYYEPLEVIQTVMESGMEGLSFSSTTSCSDNILYIEVEKEIKQLLSQVSWNTDIIKPYLWYIPDYIKQGITVENTMTNLPHHGIKLHPFAHHWDFDNKEQLGMLHKLFEYAGENHLPVLIHTGNSGVDSADKFECFFRDYTNVTFTLAHCRPLEKTIEMMTKYNNVYCDTAFVPETDIKQIVKHGLSHRIILGSDFPVTYYFSVNYPPLGDSVPISLKEQYAEDKKKLVLFNDILEEEDE
jgi:predicted TIM-barrel fold metal-dependent hydrolase